MVSVRKALLARENTLKALGRSSAEKEAGLTARAFGTIITSGALEQVAGDARSVVCVRIDLHESKSK